MDSIVFQFHAYKYAHLNQLLPIYFNFMQTSRSIPSVNSYDISMQTDRHIWNIPILIYSFTRLENNFHCLQGFQSLLPRPLHRQVVPAKPSAHGPCGSHRDISQIWRNLYISFRFYLFWVGKVWLGFPFVVGSQA